MRIREKGEEEGRRGEEVKGRRVEEAGSRFKYSTSNQ
jgi:hypothetical protein